MASHEFKSNYHQFVQSSQEQFVQSSQEQFVHSSHDFEGEKHFAFSEAVPEFVFKQNIRGQHNDKTWLDNARTCMVDVLRRDTTDMRHFGGDTVYIQTLKDILNKYDPSVPYSSLKHCNGVNEQKQLCANRRAYITQFHDKVSYIKNGNAAPRALQIKLERASFAENGNFPRQFRKWMSKEDFAHPNATPPLKKYGRNVKPDFFSPVPPYPMIESPDEDDPNEALGWKFGHNYAWDSFRINSDNYLNCTQQAHLVESGSMKWVQYLTNYTQMKVRKNESTKHVEYRRNSGSFLQVGEMNPQKIKEKLAKLEKINRAVLFGSKYNRGDDNPDYLTPFGFETLEMADLFDVQLYNLDSAANIININQIAHYGLFDCWLVDHGGSPNMSSKNSHDFFTIDTKGQVSGIVKNRTKDGREWTVRKKTANKLTDKLYPTGVGPDSKINSYWYDCSVEMFVSDRVQWLQNYRRKRWTQIRNIIMAFMVEANANPNIDDNLENNICDETKGCAFKSVSKNTVHWTSWYDEEYAAYLGSSKAIPVDPANVTAEPAQVKQPERNTAAPVFKCKLKKANALGHWKTKLEIYYGESIDAVLEDCDEVFIGFELLPLRKKEVVFCCLLKCVTGELYEMHQLKYDNIECKAAMMETMASKRPCLAMKNPVLPNTRDFLEQHGFKQTEYGYIRSSGKTCDWPKEKKHVPPPRKRPTRKRTKNVPLNIGGTKGKTYN